MGQILIKKCVFVVQAAYLRRPDGMLDSRRPDGMLDSRRPDGMLDSRRPIGMLDSRRPIGVLDSRRPGGILSLVLPNRHIRGTFFGVCTISLKYVWTNCGTYL